MSTLKVVCNFIEGKEIIIEGKEIMKLKDEGFFILDNCIIWATHLPTCTLESLDKSLSNFPDGWVYYNKKNYYKYSIFAEVVQVNGYMFLSLKNKLKEIK